MAKIDDVWLLKEAEVRGDVLRIRFERNGRANTVSGNRADALCISLQTARNN